MPTGLKRYQHEGHLHVITFSCCRRLPYLHNDPARTRLERSRRVTTSERETYEAIKHRP